MRYMKSLKRIIWRWLFYALVVPGSLFGQSDVLIWAPAMSNSATEVIANAQRKGDTLSVKKAQELMSEYSLSYGEIASSLCELGFSVETATDITTVNLNNYMAIFVILGYYPDNHVVLNGSAEAGALETYIGNGGNVYLEGGDVWYYDPIGNGHDFGPTFGILGLNDGAPNGELHSIIGSDIALGLDFDFTIGADAYPDHLASTGTGTVIHSNDNPSFDCGVRNQPAGHTIGLSSSFGDLINGSATRNDLMAAYMNFFGVTGSGCQDQPPVVDFTVIPDTIVLGDSVLADASATYDPDGDTLIYNWDVIPPIPGSGFGSHVFISVLENGVKAYLTPTGSGDFSVEITVFDGVLYADTTRSFHVKPKTENVSRTYSFVDTSWYRASMIEFNQDKLLIPIQPLDIVRIYNLEENRVTHFDDLNIPNTVKVYGIRNNLLFTGQEGNSGYWGPGPISIDSITNGWVTIPVLSNYLPGPTDIYTMKFVDDYLIATDQNTIYNIGIEPNPSTPLILASRQYLPGRPYTAFPIYSYLYVGVTGVGRRIEVLNKSSLAYVDSLDLPPDWRNFSVFDTLMFVGFYDSLQIYSIADPLDPQKLSSVMPPRPFNWMNRPPLNNYPLEFYGQYIQPNLLALWGYSNIGVVFYNIENPSDPQIKGAWYTGKGATIREHDNNYYVMGFDILGNFVAKDKYFGFNKVKLDFLTGIPKFENNNVSGLFILHQNYPNPFNPITHMSFALPKTSGVKIKVYNTLGQEVAILLDERKPAGTHVVDFDGSNLSSGVYFYKIQAGSFQQVKKMVLLK